MSESAFTKVDGFADRLRRLRVSHGAAQNLYGNRYTQQDFAKEIGLKPGSYSRYERGEAEPTLNILIRIAEVTGVSLDTLIRGRPVEPKSPPTGLLSIADITLGERMKLVRMAVDHNVAEAAALMRVDVMQWHRYEANEAYPSPDFLMDFAHRFGAGLDFLYRGQLSGIAPEVWRRVRELSPHLIHEGDPGPASGSTATPDTGSRAGGGTQTRAAMAKKAARGA